MTIRDIAKVAGVSTATVSRVINTSGYVSEQTRYKIEQVISLNKYSPSAVARSLSKQDTSTVGMIMPDVINPFFSEVIDGIGHMADSANLNLLFYNTSESLEKEYKVLKSIREQKLKGLLITPVSHIADKTAHLLTEIEESGIPVILIDRDLRGGTFDGVFLDNLKGSHDAVEALILAEHTQIAILSGSEKSKPGKERLEGYLSALDEYHIPQRKDYIVRGDFQMESGYNGCQRLIEMENPPTAIFTANNMTTLGCIKYLGEHGIFPGRDISLIGFDDIEILNIVKSHISVVQRPTREMGEIAFRMLLDRLSPNHKKRQRAREIILQTHLILRGSERLHL